MIVSIEISYYPMEENYNEIVNTFIETLSNQDIDFTYGKMSTTLIGDYTIVITQIQKAMGNLMQDYPSVFHLKISNCCPR